ncbi:D-alanyl-D-alanine carboxypeptidase family protein [Kibdelosporangium persicum]|uniref:D-alanyl-D-alanine carboxypeptidase dacB n=1 Tax=Kibdelosporangium persicum TaxID=2698649 RepID=A0ABX2F053_9PSEU|nr:D-alanyl-D-alanine carboxypeptidase [Kibdelosporangium persicum]NRN64659.1 D-alanyl-D-alanine carboxypeptidase dacB [Kibdelosporangium persicum]
MPERARQLARVLNLSLSIAAAVTFAALPVANAQPTSPSSPSRGSTATSPKNSTSAKTPGSSTTSSRPSDGAAAAGCTAKAVPPPANEGNGDQLPPLDLPEEPVGGPRMGDCGVVLPPNATLPPDGLTADSWLIADQASGDVLASYAPHARQRPAGTVKILLAMVALKEIPLDKVIVGTREDTRQLGTKVGIIADGKYLAGDLIRALIVMPAADAANALARELGGTDEAAQKMNALARELKALDTRVVNPNGNDVPGQSTSAFDTALIYREAMRLPEFAEATGSKRVQIKPQGNRNTTITRNNDNALLNTYKGTTGGKAGTTNAAKNVFVGSAERDGRHLIVTVMRSDRQPFEQAESLLDYGFKLAGARVQPIGKLAGATDQPTRPNRDAGTPTSDEKETTSLAGSNSVHRSAFGTFGLPITILAGVVVLIALLMTAKRKMARAKRLRAQGR